MNNNQPIYFFTNPEMKRIAEIHAPHLNISDHTGISIRSYVNIEKDSIFETPHVFVSSQDSIDYKDLDHYNNSYAQHFSDDGDFDLNLYNEANFHSLHEYLSETNFLLEQQIDVTLRVFCDGGVFPKNDKNATHNTYGYVIQDAKGNEITRGNGVYDGHYIPGQQISNNTGEIGAIIKAVQAAQENPHTHLKIFSDSEYAINQVTGEQRGNPQLKQLAAMRELAQQLLEDSPSWEIVHISRKHNAEADKLAKIIHRQLKEQADLEALAI